ncbi:membrane metalloprotease [Vulcanisaeta moutnovskia 768-28]|uniref:Membrane metalloprotease n=1 Tax=Vulcanisaeta moutnovskia (strain 768-28) TaxID=985053 RepID=F0QW79_VULM7|nr:peptidase M50 [Vulcanisaeta moutnovskia]ADY02174.1 membrane metalloprotease [Vulcanisaeta moutnovskia 768-28]
MNLNYWGSGGYGVPFRPYRHEIRDIVISLIAMTIAFALLFNTLLSLGGLIATFIAVLTGFLGHELMHREEARRLGYIAYFRAWWIGLLLALATSFFHFIIALPGATVIGPKVWGYPSRRDELKIALAGPATNMVFAVVFLALWLVLPSSLSAYAYLIYATNAWLGFFNLIPLALPGMMLDGFRVFRRDIRIWALAFVISIALIVPYILSFI